MLRHETQGECDLHGKGAGEDSLGTFPRCKTESLEQANESQRWTLTWYIRNS